MLRFIIFGFFLLLTFSCSRPIAEFVVEKKDSIAPATVEFINKSEEADSFYWDFGDGNFSDANAPLHKYRSSGNYTITLKAMQGKKTDEIQKQVKIDAPSSTLVEITTPHGTMIAKLYDDTPQHKENFINLIEEGFYDSLLFHRVIDGFMIQGGDPDSRGAGPDQMLGSGGPGYQVPAEMSAGHIHKKGALAAARMGDNVNPEKASSGSQFYIVHGQEIEPASLKAEGRRNGMTYTEEQIGEYDETGGTPFLDNQYTVFGEVVEGLDVIDKIASVSTNHMDRPAEDVTMTIRVIK